MSALRTALQDITDEYAGLMVGQQIPKIAALRLVQPHGILIINKARLGSPRTFNFNCHAFAFGLADVEECWQAAGDLLCPDGRWVATHILPTMQPTPEGNVVLYFDGDRVTHSARINRGILISKWGTAHTWQHGLWEVPMSYGSRVEYYQAPSVEIVAQSYLDQAAL